MRKIFIGFIWIFLDFNLNLDHAEIGLIPDFIGYIFLAKGLAELAGESLLFTKARFVAIGLGIYAGIVYAMDLYGISAQLGWLGVLLNFISAILSLYLVYEIVGGVREMESRYGVGLNGKKLSYIWRYMAIFQISVYLFYRFPRFSLICILATLVVWILFLVAFYTTKELYEALPPPNDFDAPPNDNN